MTDETALFELGHEDTTITQTLKVDMTSSENQAWTKKDTNEDAVYTVNVKECVWGTLRQKETYRGECVYPAKRETTRSHKVRNKRTQFLEIVINNF